MSSRREAEPVDIPTLRVRRFQAGHWADEDTPFCLSALVGFETQDPDLADKVDELLEGRLDENDLTTRACNIGGCTLRMTDSTESGRIITGACRASTYCLEDTFKAVDDASTPAEGRKLYGDIVHSLESHASSYSAGNFCPRLECGLSAGVSIDMVPGTAGICVRERPCIGQETIDFNSVQ